MFIFTVYYLLGINSTQLFNFVYVRVSDNEFQCKLQNERTKLNCDFWHFSLDTQDLKTDHDPDPSSGQDSDSNPDPVSDPSSDSDSDSDPGVDTDPLVPGPGFVVVVSDSEVSRQASVLGLVSS